MVISILGCGWFGKALGKSLAGKGLIVNGSTTSEEKSAPLSLLNINPYVVRFSPDEEIYNPAFFNGDVLIISVPPKFRQGETGNYLDKIKRIISIIRESKITKVIYVSSTKVYGESNSQVNELDKPIPGDEQGEILLAAEQLFQHETGFKTTILRFAGLVGPGRHPGRFFAGKTNIPNGKAPVNLIHLTDCVGITEAIIEKDAFGEVVNASSPNHPSKKDFYAAATLQAGLTVPEFIDELNDWKIVDSINITGLLNYKFKVDVWDVFNFDL